MLICEKNKRDTRLAVAFVKGIVHQAITIESSFTHLHLKPRNTKGDILKTFYAITLNWDAKPKIKLK